MTYDQELNYMAQTHARAHAHNDTRLNYTQYYKIMHNETKYCKMAHCDTQCCKMAHGDTQCFKMAHTP